MTEQIHPENDSQTSTNEPDTDALVNAGKAFGLSEGDVAALSNAQAHFDNPDLNDPGFTTALKAGVGQQAAAVARTAKDIPVIGGLGLVDKLGKWGDKVQQNNPMAIQHAADVLEHPVETLKEGAGNAIAQMPANTAGGVAGRVIGGVLGAKFGNEQLGEKIGTWVGMGLPTLVQEYGGIRQTQDQEVANGNTEADDKTRALMGALPATAVEFGMGPQNMLGRIIGEGFEGTAKQLGKKLATETAGMSAKDATRHVLTSAAKEIGRQGVAEGAEELVQNPMEAFGAHQDPLSQGTIDQSITGAALGFGGGVALGAPMVATQHHAARQMMTSGEVEPDAATTSPAPQGPLSAAAAAGRAAMPPATETPAVPVDPLADRLAGMAPTLENRDLLRQMRSDSRFGPETVTDALHAWTIGRNAALPIEARERALDALETLFGPANFNFGQQPEAIDGQARRIEDNPAAPTPQLAAPPLDPGFLDQTASSLPGSPPQPPAAAESSPSLASTPSVATNAGNLSDADYERIFDEAAAEHQAEQNTGVGTGVITGKDTGNHTGVDTGIADKSPAATLQQAVEAARADEQRKASLALIRDRIEHGYTVLDGNSLRNPKTNATHPLTNVVERLVAQNALRQRIDQAAHSAATSDHNDLTPPSDAQKAAGNYAKGHVDWHGLDLTIENPKGSERSGIDPNGKPWSVSMPAHYGYIKRTLGADGDHVDLYLGDAPHAKKVFVVDQIDADTGKFDEHKAIGNVRNLDEAKALYDAGFSDGRGPQRRGAISEMSVDAFKNWVKNGDTTKPLAFTGKPAEQAEPAKDAKPRLGESAAAVWAGIKAANGGVVVNGRTAYPAIRVPGMPGLFRLANDYTLDKLVEGGKATLKASAEENAAVDEAVEKDRAEVVALSPWGGNRGDGSQTVEQVLHYPSGNAYQSLSFNRNEGRHVEKTAETVEAEAQGSEQQQPASAVETDKPSEAHESPVQGQVGMKLASGQVVLTSSGRQTTPFPNVKTETERKTTATLKAVDRWLMQNALDEATARGDEFNARAFAQQLDKPSQSDKDSAEEYLFGEQPAVVPSILKPLVPDNEAPETPALRAITDKAKASLTAKRLTQQGLPSIVIPHPTVPNAWAIVPEDYKVTPPGDALPNATAPEHVQSGVDERELGQIVDEFNAAQSSMFEDDEKITHVFDAPTKKEIVRLADKVKVYHQQHGWMTVQEAKKRINEWKEHTRAQGETPANADKIILSLFDYTGKWSQPWEEAGYQVYRFDIQNDPEMGDVNKFSADFMNDWFSDFEGQDIYGILAACPCTDFAVSGAKHFAAKDKDGRTVASVKLVHQTLATIEYFRPAIWAIENPVGRIEELGGLPPWRLSFDPNHLGDPYTKKTLLWGRFNADLPIAPVEPTEGSKMHKLYGGKSMATKNARSATPEGFAYGFFMANNAIDHPAMALANKYDRLDKNLIAQALEAGVKSADIESAVEDYYYMDLDDAAANQAIKDLIAEQTPPEPTADLPRVEPASAPDASTDQAQPNRSDIDVEETRIGMEVDRTDRDNLADWLSDDMDPATGKKIHSEGRRRELKSELENLTISVANAEEFLRNVPPEPPKKTEAETAPQAELPFGINIAQFKHTKTQEAKFSVVLPVRTSKEDYQALNALAIKHGGRYSRYNTDGAVAGFLFNSEEKARAFVTSAKMAEVMGRYTSTPGDAGNVSSPSLPSLTAETPDDTIPAPQQEAQGQSTTGDLLVKAGTVLSDEYGENQWYIDNDLRDNGESLRVTINKNALSERQKSVTADEILKRIAENQKFLDRMASERLAEKQAKDRAAAESDVAKAMQDVAILANTLANTPDNFDIEAERQVTQWLGDQIAAAIEAGDGERARTLSSLLSNNKPVLPASFYTGLRETLKQKAVIAQQDALKDQAKTQADLAFAKASLPDEQQATFLQGWEHALAGKTKSTLPANEAAAKGYEAAREWLTTPEGRAAFTGKKSGKKLENTGADLRRWFDKQRAKVRDDSDDETVIAALDVATNRADLLRSLLADDATPGAQRWFEGVRFGVMTFKQWINDRGPLRSTYGRYSKIDSERIANYLQGIAGPREEDGERDNSQVVSSWKSKLTREQRIQRLRDAAQEYATLVGMFSDAIQGVKTVEEGARALGNLLWGDRVHDAVMNVYDQRNYSDSGKLASSILAHPDRTAWKFAWNGKGLDNQTYALRELVSKEADALTSSKKAALLPPRLDRVERTGEDYRGGTNISPEQFKRKFNMADVGFGEWVNSRQDQDHLNYSYDAFLDLAKLLNLSPEAISLGGRLYFTIAALGHGKFAAHYSPEQPHPNGGTVPVINVTNTRGDGTLAHEWAHALDLTPQGNDDRDGGNPTYLARAIDQIRNDLRYAYNFDDIKNGVMRMLRGESWWKGDKSATRTDQGLIANAKHAIDFYSSNNRQQSAYYRAALKLDGSNTKDPYWSNRKELFARAFEAWVVDALNGTSTYLVNPAWAGEGAVTGETHRGTPYPIGEERERFAKWFDALSKSLIYDAERRVVGLDAEKWAELKPQHRKEWEEALQDLSDSLPAMLEQVKMEKKIKEAADQEALLEARRMKEGDRVRARAQANGLFERFPEAVTLKKVVPASDGVSSPGIYFDYPSKDDPTTLVEHAYNGQFFRIEERAEDIATRRQAEANALAEQEAPAVEPSGDLSDADYERLFDEAAAELGESAAEKPDVPEPTAIKMPDGWTVEDVRQLRNLIDDGKIVLVASTDLGLPTIHDYSANATHLGFGTFRVTTPEYEAIMDCGGAMSHTASGQSYTVVQVSRGTFPYDAAAAKQRLDALLSGEETIAAPKEETPPADNAAPIDARVAAILDSGPNGLREKAARLALTDFAFAWRDAYTSAALDTLQMRDNPTTEAEAEAIYNRANDADFVTREAQAYQQRFGKATAASAPSKASHAGKARKAKLPTVDEQAKKTAAGLIADAAKLGVSGIDEALTGLVKLFGGGAGRLMSFPGGIDEATYKAAKPHFEAALAKFQEAGHSLKDLFKWLIEKFGLGIKPYAMRFAKENALSADLAPKVSARSQVVDFVKDKLAKSESFTGRQLFDAADKAFGGTQAEGTYSPKDAYDAMEIGVNRYLLATPFPLNVNADKAADIASTLHEKILRLPTQTRRDAEMDEYQQFSTPPALAYVANWAAGVKEGDVMAEPSAGTGDLAVWARKAGADLILNELSSRRAAGLKELFPGARIFTENAEQLNNVLPADAVPTVVVMNPPFSSTAGRISGERDTKNGARHIEQALKRLAPGGRLVAIVGNGMAADRAAFRDWWKKIAATYNVRANIGIDGSEYAKYGTTFDNQILVIDKDGPTKLPLVTGKVSRVAELPALLERIRDERPEPQRSQASQPDADQPGGSGVSQPNGLGNQRHEPERVDTDLLGAGERTESADNQRGGGLGQSAGDATGAGGVHQSGNRRDGRGRESDAGGHRDGNGPAGRGSDVAGKPDSQLQSGAVTVEDAKGDKPVGEFTDSVFENYYPQRLSIPGAKEHPGMLVQSAAMAAVDPPAAAYTPNLPKNIIDQGLLSIAQLESVVYAGQAHAQLLPNGERRGFFIGDGTGVGKGREIAGIILDNMRQGRQKAVWVSFNEGLINDAKRDFSGIGGDKDLIFWLGKTKADGKITAKNGIVFTTYSTLGSGGSKKQVGEDKDGKKIPPKTRGDQLVEWLGEDFDGVLVFDESHSMGNALEMKGKRGKKKPSQQALAGVDLQKRLPKARIVYVSATGATELSNLTYASRLGLWGEGTPFANPSKFVSDVSGGGVAAMELIARDMKALGMYIARSLSYDGVTYERLEHNLTPLQNDIYNELAKTWQTVLNNVTAALEVTGQEKDSNAKGAALSAFWSSHQRFFNQIITSMQTPTVIENMRQQIAAGHAVVIQLTNTNEAEQERQVAKAKASETPIEELDFTPRQGLMDYVRNGFPVAAYEEYEDDNGNKKSRPVTDANGNLVMDAEAVAMRDRLLETLEQIRVPENPIDAIINAFGSDKVGEVTGRKRRFVQTRDEHGNLTVIEEKRGHTAARSDADAFQNDKKPILIFSQAGGTGYSFHADRTAKNQRKRIHYILQPGWRADVAVQGTGRSHRTNQAETPHYVLPTTNLKAQKRFVSTIARRMDQLGALTRGQRQAAGQGLFTAADNLESKYADEALDVFFNDLYTGKTSLNFGEVTHAMGLTNLINEKTGGLNTSNLPEIPRFLNRLLSLQSHEQDAVFEEFSKRLDEIVNLAIQHGEYDNGLQTLTAQAIVKTRDDVAHTDERTGAETRYVELNVTDPIRYVPWSDAKHIATYPDFDGWYKDAKGRLFGLRDLGTRVDASGKEVHRGARYDVQGRVYYVDNFNEIKQGYRYVFKGGTSVKETVATKVDQKDVAAGWNKEIAASPKTRTTRERLIVGVILPVWDRVKGHSTIYRLQTDAGERMIGRMLNAAAAKETLKNLGLGSTVSKMSTSAQLERVRDGAKAILANGWEINQTTVSGEKRIEVRAPSGYFGSGDAAILKTQGVFFERIQWNDRAFIPTGEQADAVFARVVQGRPVVELIGGKNAEGQAHDSNEDGDEVLGSADDAPVFYSQLQRAIENAPDKVFGSPVQFRLWLSANAAKLGIKKDEIAWSGINDWLDARGRQKVSKEEVVDYLQNGGVQIQEVMKGVRSEKAQEHRRKYDEIIAARNSGEISPDDSRDRLMALHEEYGYKDGFPEDTKFSAYTLPGGEDYRELLLTLPERSSDWTAKDQAELNRLQGMNNRGELDPRRNPEGKRLFDELQAKWKARAADTQNFRSSHWDEPNVVAHVRFNTRTDADGAKVLFIEELQSDWGQKGKKEGFRQAFAGKASPVVVGKEMTLQEFLDENGAEGKRWLDMQNTVREDLGEKPLTDNSKIQALYENGKMTRATSRIRGPVQQWVDMVTRGYERMRLAEQYDHAAENIKKVPSAPFVTGTKSWLTLAMKRMVRYAAENGYDKIAFVNGEQSADRYDLSNQVDAIGWLKHADGTVTLGLTKDGREFDHLNVPSEKLEDSIGKDAAQKITENPGDAGELSGIDLKVGGEGMKAFYDQIVPQVVSDLIKKTGGKIETVRLDSYDKGTGAKHLFEKLSQPGFTITPAMRETVMNGQPLFKQTQESTVSATDKAVYGMVGEGATTPDVLKFIASASRDPFYRSLAKLLMDTGVNPALVLGEAKGWKFAAGKGRNYAAAYNPKTDTAALFRPANAERHLLHELLHAATLKAIENRSLHALKLRALYAQVKRSGQLQGLYGMSNLEEFVAEAFTNPAFQEKLRAVKVSPIGAVKNAWHWFVRIVSGILRLNPGQDNALAAVIDVGLGLMHDNMKLRGAEKAGATEEINITDLKPDMAGAVSRQDREWKRVGRNNVGPVFYGDGFTVEAVRKFNTATDFEEEDGLPLGHAAFVQGDAYRFAIYDRNLNKLGFMDAEVNNLDEISALHDIDLTKRGTGFGSKLVETMLASTYDGVRIVEALEQSKRFWEKFGASYDYRNNAEINWDAIKRPAGAQSALEESARRGRPVPRGEAQDRNEAAEESLIYGHGSADEAIDAVNGSPSIDGWRDVLHSPDKLKALRTQINDLFQSQKTFNWWHRTVGTQFHKAKIDTLPGVAAGGLGTFGAVVDRAQRYVDDTSRLAAEAADLAPGLLPKTAGLLDALKSVYGMVGDQRNAQAISGPLFQGTLHDRLFSDDELKNPPRDEFGKPMFAPLNDVQVGLYHQYLATINRSLDDLAISEMARLSQTAKMQQAPMGLSLRQAVNFYREQYSDALDDAKTALENLKEQQAGERKLLDEAARDKTAGAEELNKFAALRERMNTRHHAELLAAEKTLADLEELDKGITGRAETIDKLKSQAYVPLMRVGRYTVDVSYQDDQGRVINDADGQPMRPFFGMYEDEATANKIARALRAEYPGATVKQGIMSQHAAAMFKGVTPETIEVFARLMGAEQDEAFQNYLKLAVNNRSAMKRLIHRVGVQGFNDDPTRVLATFITSNARAAAGNYHLGEMLRATAAIPQHKGDVKDEAIKLAQYMQNPQDEGAWVRSLLFANFLGGSVASALVNMSQTFTTTIPFLHQFGGNTVSNVLSAMKAAALRMGPQKNVTGDAVLDKALKRAEEEGVVAPHEIHMLQGESMRSGVLTGNRYTRAIMKAWGHLFSLAEQYNREVAFIAAYKVAQAKRMRGEEAYQFASDAVVQTQFSYSKAARPNWGRGPVGATLMTFKTFTINYLEFLKRLPPKERAMALSIIFLAAGAQGLPFAGDLEDLIDTIMQTLGFNWNTQQERRAAIANLLGDGAAGFIERGVSYGLPIDISSRLGLSNLIPGTGAFKPSQTNKTREVAELFGAAGGAVQQAANAVFKLQGGDFAGFGATLAPKAIRDLIKGAEMGRTGYYADSLGRRVADVSLTESIAKGMGFQPEAIAEDARVRNIVMDQLAHYRSVQGKIHALWAEGVFEHDPEKIAKAQADLLDWNNHNPEAKMTVSRAAILRRVRQSQLTSDQRLVNTAPRQFRSELRSTLSGDY